MEDKLYDVNPEYNNMLVRQNGKKKHTKEKGLIIQNCHRCSKLHNEGTTNPHSSFPFDNKFEDGYSNYAFDDFHSDKDLSVATFKSKDVPIKTKGCLGCHVLPRCTCENRNDKVKAMLKKNKNLRKRKGKKNRKDEEMRAN
jgi:hypothetical protein